MTSTSTATRSTALQWTLGLFHGASQIYFQQNVVTGVLIIAAFFVADWRMGILAVLGAAAGMLGGRAMRFSLADVSSGMQSFCGMLVGAAVFAALGGSSWWCYAAAVVGGLATGPVTWLINALFTMRPLARFALPYTTAPFVIVATVLVVSTSRLAVTGKPAVPPAEPLPAFLLSLVTNVSQVVLVGNAVSGALILLGLAIANWKVGVAAVLGSVVGSLTAIVAGQPWSEVAGGLDGYSGVLTAIAVSVAFFRSSLASWLYAVPWIVVTAVVTFVMHALGVDTYTWPYILTTWVALVIAHFLGRPKRS